MPGVDYYADLLRDRRRIDAFLRAIASTVRPGDHVVDVGTGLGTFARAAAHAGARRVTALEADPTAAALARELGLERDFGGRVRLIEGEAERVTLDEPADLILFEDFGRFAWHPHLRRILEAMRTRMAAPRTRYLPELVELFAAPTDMAVTSVEASDPRLPFPPDALALLRKRHLSLPRPEGVNPAELLAPGVSVGELRPGAPVEPRKSYRGEGSVARRGAATGLAVWMRLHLGAGIDLSNDPSLGPTAWKQMVLPFEEPLVVERGDRVEFDVEIAHGSGPSSELWRWAMYAGSGRVEGSTANALPGDLDFLKRGSPDHVPRPSPWHAAIAEVCRMTSGTKTASEIARTIYNSYQELFVDESAAGDWVLELLARLRPLTPS